MDAGIIILGIVLLFLGYIAIITLKYLIKMFIGFIVTFILFIVLFIFTFEHRIATDQLYEYIIAAIGIIAILIYNNRRKKRELQKQEQQPQEEELSNS